MAFTKIQLRRDTRNNWGLSTTVPAEGELCYESTINSIKFGNGTDQFKNLPYFTGLGLVSFEIILNSENLPEFSAFKANSLDISSGDISMSRDSTGIYTFDLPSLIRNNFFIVPFVEFNYNSLGDGGNVAAEYSAGDLSIYYTSAEGSLANLTSGTVFTVSLLLLPAKFSGGD